MKDLLTKLSDAKNRERQFEVATYEIISKILEKVEGIERLKVFSGILNQSGSYTELDVPPLTIGRTYVAALAAESSYFSIDEMYPDKFIIGNRYKLGLAFGDDFDNIGHRGNQLEFRATGEIPTDWSNGSEIIPLSADNFSNVGGGIAFEGMTFKAVGEFPINWQAKTMLIDFAHPEATVFRDDFNNINIVRKEAGIYALTSELPIFTTNKTSLLFLNVPAGVSIEIRSMTPDEIEFWSIDVDTNTQLDDLIQGVFFELKVLQD
jgi:hypothetical protein